VQERCVGERRGSRERKRVLDAGKEWINVGSSLALEVDTEMILQFRRFVYFPSFLLSYFSFIVY
jgi:hypothetical protein